MHEFKRDKFGRVLYTPKDSTIKDSFFEKSSSTVEAHIMLSILEKLQEIAHINREILGEIPGKIEGEL